jgi:RNA polymerase sigma-70 factor (ECF subfamily)
MERYRHNRKEFEQLYKKHAAGLIFYARKFVDYQTAEDVVHDVFLKIWFSESVMLVNENISSYLFNAVRNMCLDLLKHQAVHDDYVSKAVLALKMEELASDENIVDKLIEQEKIDAVYKAIDRLPEKCREVFVQAYIEEKKNVEIAEQLHISVRTVEAHIFKALKLLRDVLTIVIFFCFA